jgi:hypothetical protein
VLRELIDFDRPVALLLVAVLHFVRDEEDPAGIIAELTAALPAGSHLVLSHGTADFDPDQRTGDAASVYQRATASLSMRSHAEILSFFDGFEVLEPGLVQVPLWRPDEPLSDEFDLARMGMYGGVGVRR